MPRLKKNSSESKDKKQKEVTITAYMVGMNREDTVYHPLFNSRDEAEMYRYDLRLQVVYKLNIYKVELPVSINEIRILK